MQRQIFPWSTLKLSEEQVTQAAAEVHVAQVEEHLWQLTSLLWK